MFGLPSPTFILLVAESIVDKDLVPEGDEEDDAGGDDDDVQYVLPRRL